LRNQERVFREAKCYIAAMTATKSLETLLERAASLPAEAQEELVDAVAQAIDTIEAKHAGVYRLSGDEQRGIERGLAAMRAGRFASEEEIAAIFRKARAPRA
jgi:predicted transcriptional regulator